MMQRWLVALVLALGVGGVAAGEDTGKDHAAARETIRAALQGLQGGLAIDAIEPSPVKGLYSVVVNGNVVYVTADGRHVLQGDLMDLETGRSHTEALRGGVRMQEIAEVGEERMLVYEPDGETRHEVTVFTDIDCGYCRRFHRHMAEYNARGIRVRYLFMPRAGIGSDAYDKAVNAWCADRPHEALTRAKNGVALAERDCDNPVADHYRLSQALGFRGTPTVLTEEGARIGGYLPPDQLVRRLEAARGGSPSVSAR